MKQAVRFGRAPYAAQRWVCVLYGIFCALVVLLCLVVLRFGRYSFSGFLICLHALIMFWSGIPLLVYSLCCLKLKSRTAESKLSNVDASFAGSFAESPNATAIPAAFPLDSPNATVRVAASSFKLAWLAMLACAVLPIAAYCVYLSFRLIPAGGFINALLQFAPDLLITIVPTAISVFLIFRMGNYYAENRSLSNESDCAYEDDPR